MDGVVGEVRPPDPSIPMTISPDGDVAQTVAALADEGWGVVGADIVTCTLQPR